MNERPWWKLSWPAVVAGLVMLSALAVKNLETKSGDYFTSVGSGGVIEERGFPLVCETKQIMQFVRMVHLGKGQWQVLSSSVSGLRIGANVLCAILLISGTSRTIARWQSREVISIRWSITVRGLLAITGTVAAYMAMVKQDLVSMSQLATGVVFAGIFLTCFAVIDWIGSLWSLVTRRGSVELATQAD